MSLFSRRHVDLSPKQLGRKLLLSLARPASEFTPALALELITAGADIHMADEDGNSALTLAAREGHTSIVAALVAKGADINHRNADRTTPLMLAAYYGHSADVVMLLNAGARADLFNHSGSTAASWAKQQGHSHIAELVDEAESRRLHAAVEKAAAVPPSPAKEKSAPPPKVRWPKGFEL